MPGSPLAEAHIEAQRRLRVLVERAARRIWGDLPGYDEEHVAPFLAAVVPVVLAGQRQSAQITNAYLAKALRRQPLPLDTNRLTGAGVRNGAEPREVYRRPFVQVWAALQAGKLWADAVRAAEARVGASAAMDVQLSMRAAANEVQSLDDNIFGYQRVTDGAACQFCSAINGAYVKSADAMPLHNHCGCGLEPLTDPHPRAVTLPSGVSVHEHGELGPVLGAPDHSFTGPSDL